MKRIVENCCSLMNKMNLVIENFDFWVILVESRILGIVPAMDLMGNVVDFGEFERRKLNC